MGFDIGGFDSRTLSEAGIDMQLVHPVTGPVFDDSVPPKPVTIKLGGPDSPRIKALLRARFKERQADATAKGETLTIEKAEEFAVEDLLDFTLGWSDNWEHQGKPLPFSRDNARMIYTSYPEIMEQAAKKVGPRVNFMRTSSKA